jgi:hypothetical protein
MVLKLCLKHQTLKLIIFFIYFSSFIHNKQERSDLSFPTKMFEKIMFSSNKLFNRQSSPAYFYLFTINLITNLFKNE